MKRIAARPVFIVTFLVLAAAAAVLYAFPQSLVVWIATPGRFGVGTAILVAGYIAFPMLAVLAAGLSLIAVLLLSAAALERRRPDRETSFPREEH